MIELKGHIDVPADRLKYIQAALPLHTSLSLAENGCVSFTVTPCPNVPGRFLVSEVFTSQVTFAAHQERVEKSEWGRVSIGIVRTYQIKEVT